MKNPPLVSCLQDPKHPSTVMEVTVLAVALSLGWIYGGQWSLKSVNHA